MLGGSGAHHLGNNSNANNNNAIYRQKLKEKEEEVALLQERVNSLSSQLQTALIHNNDNHNNSNNNSNAFHGSTPGSKKKKRRHIPLSPHAMNVREVHSNEVMGGGNNNNNNANNNAVSSNVNHGKSFITAHRERLGRNASIATQRVLERLEVEQEQQQQAGEDARPPLSSYGGYNNNNNNNVHTGPLPRILDMFQRPAAHVEYLHSPTFAKDLYKVALRVRTLLERDEPRVVYLQSPCYVLGDIHGNLEDLHFFADNLWRLGLSLTAGNVLCLGDYVDRGMQCLECVAYLLALKLQNPHKLFLLRGNHETRDVNGWEEHYGERSFIFQCRSRFGDDIGYRLWEVCNQTFDRLPLAAVIDQDIFCVHGGIPRPLSDSTTRIQDILTVPKVAGINPPYEHEDEKYQQVASDCIWSDPASDKQEASTVDPHTGYGESLRGGGAICFGHLAVTQFLQQQDFSYIMRAHEAHAEGVAVAKGARVFTVFSTSKDHNQGAHAMAGCILVDNDKLQVINRSAAYKNQYVHRRDSVSLANVSDVEIQKRIQLGLVTAANTEEEQDDEVVGEDIWQDFDDNDTSSEEESARSDAVAGGKDIHASGSSASGMLTEGENGSEYVFDKNRRSSVDLSSMNAPPLLGMDLQQQSTFHIAQNPFPSFTTASSSATSATSSSMMYSSSSVNSSSSMGSVGAMYEQPNQKRNRASSISSFAPIDENNAEDHEENDDNEKQSNDDDDAEIDTVDGGESDDVMGEAALDELN